jgi:LysR family transcriptional regulator, regulator for bpeEF and oprC
VDRCANARRPDHRRQDAALLTFHEQKAHACRRHTGGAAFTESVIGIHKLRALEYLVAVVEHGGFNAAARKLGVAAPSVNRLVKALESELDMVLLDRSSLPLRPTPDALAYVERARQLVTELHRLDASLHDRANAPSGTVVVAAQSVVLQFVLAELLPRFHTRYPTVSVDLVDAGIERDLSRLGTDVLMQFGWPIQQQASVRTLAYTRWLIVATPAYWARHGVPSHPSELARHSCALFRTPYGEVMRRWGFERAGERVDVDVDGWLVGDHRAALDAPVYAGQMVGRINDLTAHPGVRSGTLQPVLLDWVGLNSPPLNLLIRRATVRQPRLRAWVDFLVEEVEQMTRHRLPAGLPPVLPSQRPDWFKRRTG